MKVAIRADASQMIGSGHVMRCLALADVLAAGGDSVCFVSRGLPDHLAATILSKGYGLRLLAAGADERDSAEAAFPAEVQAGDAAETAALLAGEATDWLVVDHYGLGSRWEAACADAAPRLLAVDDIHREHRCALLLDQNLQTDPAQAYRGLVPDDAGLLIGPGHALLRDKFAALREGLLPRSGPVRRVLLFMGGMDRDNATGLVLRALARAGIETLEIDVVIGATHPAREAVETLCRALPAARLHVQTPSMAALMAAADLAIGGGGSATWERCALGLPTIALCVAENQRALLENAAAAGLVDMVPPPLDETILAGHLERLIADEERRRGMSRAGMALVDGLGARRVAERMRAA